MEDLKMERVGKVTFRPNKKAELLVISMALEKAGFDVRIIKDSIVIYK